MDRGPTGRPRLGAGGGPGGPRSRASGPPAHAGGNAPPGNHEEPVELVVVVSQDVIKPLDLERKLSVVAQPKEDYPGMG